MIFLFTEQLDESRKKNHGAHDDRDERRDEDGARGNVLRDARFLVVLFNEEIDDGFGDAVDEFGEKDEADGHGERDAFSEVDRFSESRKKNDSAEYDPDEDDIDSKIPLRADRVSEPRERVK